MEAEVGETEDMLCKIKVHAGLSKQRLVFLSVSSAWNFQGQGQNCVKLQSLTSKRDLTQVPFATTVFKDNLRILCYCGCFRVILSLKSVAIQDLSTRSMWLLCERPVPAPGSVVWPPGPQGCASSWAWSQGSCWDPVGLAVIGLLGPFFRISSEALPVLLLKQESTAMSLSFAHECLYVYLVYEKGVPLILCGGSIILEARQNPVLLEFQMPRAWTSTWKS